MDPGVPYAQGKPEQLKAVRRLLDEPAFAFENRDAVASALALCERSACGFSDRLIAAWHAALGCAFTATVDKRMRKLEGVRMV